MLSAAENTEGARSRLAWEEGRAECSGWYTYRMSASHPLSRRRAGQPVPRCISRLTLRQKRWIELDGRFAIGEGGAELLRAVDLRGSLAEGARQIGWSYRHA